MQSVTGCIILEVIRALTPYADNLIGESTMNVQGPDFIALQWRDVAAGKRFYQEMLGLELAPSNPPGAFVVDTKPIAFAVREPLVDLDLSEYCGHGVALWLLTDDTEALLGHLEVNGVEIVKGLGDSPFGKMFTFRDPEGYLVTIHDRG